MERNRIKIGWTTALIAIGWVLMFMPSAEDLPDAEPASRADWIVWMGINVVALGAVHYWISQPSREQSVRLVQSKVQGLWLHVAHNSTLVTVIQLHDEQRTRC